MGGDRAPGEIVAGARQVVEQAGIEVVLVGRPGEMGDIGSLPCLPAGEVIGMDDDPGQSVRRKKDSSLVRAAEAVRDGKAMAMVSAGNTGAAMASALLRMGRLPKVIRPAIATPDSLPRRSVADRSPRLRSQRGVHSADVGAVRPDGCGLRPKALWTRAAPGRPSLHR